MAQTVQSKAIAYLTEGKIKVDIHLPERAVFKAYGSAETPYLVTFDSGGWACTCPAHVAECAHIVAAKLVSPLRVVERPVIGKSDTNLDAFFSQFATEGEF